MILFLAVFVYFDRAAGATPGSAAGGFATGAVATGRFVTEGSATGERGMPLPKRVGSWKLSEAPRRIEPQAIFDYMDGGGELYLGYRFRHLDVYDYRDPADTQILLEVYQMETSDDAFGLLSLDSDGQEVTFGSEASPAGRGIYGAGLLRLWSGDVFARILAEKETPESRDAVMQLAKALTTGRARGSAPAFVSALPAEFSTYRLNSGQVSFLRSHLVLNSIYFLGSQNILKLNLKAKAVTAAYRTAGADQPTSARILEVSYETPGAADAAFLSFTQSYLPEHKCSGAVAGGTCHIEDGWIAYRLVGKTLVLGFQLPSEEVARLCLDKATEQLHNWEKSHE